MKKLVKLKVFLLAFSIILSSQANAGEQILPVQKPTVDKETKIKTAKKKEIYPKKKPSTKSEEKSEEIQKISATKIRAKMRDEGKIK